MAKSIPVKQATPRGRAEAREPRNDPSTSAQASEALEGAEEQADEPAQRTHRTTKPAVPFVVGPTSQDVCITLKRIVDGARPVVRDQGHSAQNALTLARTVPVRNLIATVGQYKAEVIDYLEGQVQEAALAEAAKAGTPIVQE